MTPKIVRASVCRIDEHPPTRGRTAALPNFKASPNVPAIRYASEFTCARKRYYTHQYPTVPTRGSAPP